VSEDLFERARREASILDVAQSAGLKLRRQGKSWRGLCPFGGCGSKHSQPFSVMTDRNRFKCFVCDARGDVVDLEHRLNGTGAASPVEAARRLLGMVEDDPIQRARRSHQRAREVREAEASDAWKAELARRMWAEATPAAGTLAQTYLEHRGIRGPVAARALAVLRFHPQAYHSGHPQFGLFLPAMVAPIVVHPADAGVVHGPWHPKVGGPVGAGQPVWTGGVHVTYLRPDGKGKASLREGQPAKRMWGPQGVELANPEGARMIPGGIWLTSPYAAGPLVVAEGIENALSRAMMLAGDLSLPVRAAAAGSLDRLQGGELSDDQGVVDVWRPTGDPARPPFTWPESPLAPWGQAEIACDSDMKPVKVRGWAGKVGGRRREVEFERDAAERARVCARLAIAAWRRRLAPRSGSVVRASRPPAGRDFNNILTDGIPSSEAA
jgi:hypothetical protein